MISCHSRELLLEFLAGQLPTSAEEELTRHIDSCPTCLQALEQMTALDQPEKPAGAPVGSWGFEEAETLRRGQGPPRPSLPEEGETIHDSTKNPRSDPRTLRKLYRPRQSRRQAARCCRRGPPGRRSPVSRSKRSLAAVAWAWWYPSAAASLNRRVALENDPGGPVPASQEQIVRFLIEAEMCA